MTVKSYSRENVYTQKTGKLIKSLRNNQERKEKVSRLKKKNLKIKHMMHKVYKVIKDEKRLFISAREWTFWGEQLNELHIPVPSIEPAHYRCWSELKWNSEILTPGTILWNWRTILNLKAIWLYEITEYITKFSQLKKYSF